MKLFYVRHQAAGVLYEHPFAEQPSQAEVDALLEKCADAHGEKHRKTEKKFWAKVVCVENGTMTTVCCASGGCAEDVDALASGECPIREAGLKRWPEAEEGESTVALKVSVTATGHVK